MHKNTRTAICTIFFAEYCDQPGCLSVCPWAYLWNRWTYRHEILCADPLWPWLGPHPAALCYVMYFWFMDDVTIALNGQYGVAWPVWAATSCQLRVRPGRSMMSMNACFLLLSCGHRSLLWVYDSQTHSSRSSDLYHKITTDNKLYKLWQNAAWYYMAICASPSDVALLLVNRLKTNIFFVNVPFKFLSPEACFSPMCTKYHLAHWGSLQCSPRVSSWI